MGFSRITLPATGILPPPPDPLLRFFIGKRGEALLEGFSFSQDKSLLPPSP